MTVPTTKLHRVARGVITSTQIAPGTVIAVSLMLFSMFFGAGNLIFPPIVGAESGSNFLGAMSGFLLGAVALPVLSIVAVAAAGRDIRDLGLRGGRVFAVGFAVATYLAIGALYAIPRTGAVSFSTAVSPVLGWTSTSASIAFNFVFFTVALALSLNPGSLVDKLGKMLTPLLLLLLAALVLFAFFTLTGGDTEPAQRYQSAPVVGGLVDGYMTMDSLGALAFGTLVMSTLRARASKETKHAALVSTAALTAAIAGGLLALIYVGLGFIGHAIPHGQEYGDGAALLSDAARQTLGAPGQLVFGLIVLLACMTTAVGLLASTAEFFHRLVPKVSYRLFVIMFCVFSFGVASLGLSAVLQVAGPIINFLYPIAITVVVLTLIDKLIPITMQRGFLFGVWTAVIVSILSVAARPLAGWLPLSGYELGWVLPVSVAALLGAVVDKQRPE